MTPEQFEAYQEQALLSDREIEMLEDRGVNMDDPKAIRAELDLIESEAEDREDDKYN
jgi:hypothetical protein